MYEIIKLRSKIRVPPKLFNLKVNEAISQVIKEEFEGLISQENGLFLSLISVDKVGDGRIIPGDGAVYYDTTFSLLSYRPIMNELIEGEVVEITEKGAFIKIGPIDGFVHNSQVMDDYVIFSGNTLQGKETKKVLRVGDKVRARVITVSLKDLQSTKIGLTMRQEGLGALSWYQKGDKK